MGASTVYAQAEIARDNANNLFNEVTEAESKFAVVVVVVVLNKVSCSMKTFTTKFVLSRLSSKTNYIVLIMLLSEQSLIIISFLPFISAFINRFLFLSF